MVAVLGSLSLARTHRLLGALLEDPEFPFVVMENQPSRGGAGVPDAEISGSFRILVETKTALGAVDTAQLRRHLARLDGSHATEQLLVVTPDERAPAEIERIDDERLVWSSFAGLDQAVDEMLADPHEVISEREAFLLRELQAMLVAERLVRAFKEGVVVPARSAWPIYERWHAYLCQVERGFQAVKRLAFYTEGEIKTVVPAVLAVEDRVVFEPGKHGGAMGEFVTRFLASPEGATRRGSEAKVFPLSAPDDPRTLTLDAPIANDLVTKAGRPSAFTQNQRYVTEAGLRPAKWTSELGKRGDAEE